MGNVQDKISKKLQSDNESDIASGVKTFESHVLSSSGVKLSKGNFFNYVFGLMSDILSNAGKPVEHRRLVADGLRSLSKVSQQVAVAPGFQDPLARHIYPSLILGLFETDPVLNAHIISALDALNERNLLPLWHDYVANALEYVQAQSATGAGTDTATHVLQNLLSHGRQLCLRSGTSTSERLSKEARIVFYFILNILRFEKRPACLAAVLLELNTALAASYYLEPHILTTALSSATNFMSEFGDTNQDNVSDLSAACIEAIITAYNDNVDPHVERVIRVTVEQLKNKDARLEWKRWNFRLVSLCLHRQNSTVISGSEQLQDLIVDATLTCLDEFQSFTVGGTSSADDDTRLLEPRHHAVYEAALTTLQAVLSLPRIGAWRGIHYLRIMQHIARATVYTRSTLRVLLGPTIAILYESGRLSFVHDFSKLLIYYLAWFLSQESLHRVLAYSNSNNTRPEDEQRDAKKWPAPHVESLDQCPQDEAQSTSLFSFLSDYMRYPAASNFAFLCDPTNDSTRRQSVVDDDPDLDPFNNILARHLTQTSDVLSQLLTVFSENTPDRRVFATVLTIFGGEFQRTRQLLLSNAYSHAMAGIVLRVLDTNTVASQRRVGELEMEVRSLQTQVATMRARAGQLVDEQGSAYEKKEDLERQLDELQQSLCCCICLDSFIGRDPVALECGHILCQDCSDRVAAARSSSQRKCPQCRHTLSRPPLALKGLG